MFCFDPSDCVPQDIILRDFYQVAKYLLSARHTLEQILGLISSPI